MNILMIGSYKPKVGGLSHVVQALATQFSFEHKVYVVDIKEAGMPKGHQHWKDGDIDVYTERFYNIKYLYLPIQTIIQTTKRAMRLRKKVDLYHTHGPFYSGIGFIDKRKPLVMTMHGYPGIESAASGRIKPDSMQFKFIMWVTKKTLERADAVITVDKRISRWIINELGADPKKVFHIPNASDPERFRPDISGKKIIGKFKLEGKSVILFLKGFSIKNGPEVIIKAMSHIIKKYPDTYLLMAGDGPMKDILIELVSELKIENNVIFCGSIPNDETPYYYAASDIVTVPSVSIAGVEEATSLTMLEGMSSGKPVVASDIGGLKEVIGGKKDKKIGLLFKESNSFDLADKITLLLENPLLRNEIGNNAREFIEKERTWEMNAKKVLEGYSFAIESHMKK